MIITMLCYKAFVTHNFNEGVARFVYDCVGVVKGASPVLHNRFVL